MQRSHCQLSPIQDSIRKSKRPVKRKIYRHLAKIKITDGRVCEADVDAQPFDSGVSDDSDSVDNGYRRAGEQLALVKRLCTPDGLKRAQRAIADFEEILGRPEQGGRSGLTSLINRVNQYGLHCGIQAMNAGVKCYEKNGRANDVGHFGLSSIAGAITNN